MNGTVTMFGRRFWVIGAVMHGIHIHSVVCGIVNEIEISDI